MIEYKTYSYNEYKTKNELVAASRYLTLHAASGMNLCLTQMERNYFVNNSVKCKIAFAFEDNNIIGWAFLCDRSELPPHIQSMKNSKSKTIMIFVNPNFRGRSVGFNLFKSLRKFGGSQKIGVCPWDYYSKKFYQHIEKKYKIEDVWR